MKWLRLLLIASVSIIPLPAHTADRNTHAPGVDQQLKILTEKLDLTASEQTSIKPILQALQDATQKLVDDKSLSPDERLAKIRPYRYKTREQLRGVLNEGQKEKLDEYLQGPHQEMHGDLTGRQPATH